MFLQQSVHNHEVSIGLPEISIGLHPHSRALQLVRTDPLVRGRPRMRSSSFMVLVNLSEALSAILKMQPSRSLHRPLKLVLDSRSGPWILVRVLLTLYLFGLDACPLLFSVDPFISLPSGDRDGLFQTTPFRFSYSYVSFTDYVP